MRWCKRNIWKIGIAIVGTLLLLVLIVCVPVSAANVQEMGSGLTGPGTVTVQATPTEDATVTALSKEKLAQEINQLKNGNSWAWLSPFSTLGTLGTIILGIVVVWLNFRQWSKNRDDEQKKRADDQRIEREKRDEERFQSVVEGLGSERTETKVGSAIMLRTFLQEGYERFYRQAFDLAVAHLRLPRTSHPPEDPDTPLSLTTLSQALIVVFKEAFPLAQSQGERSPRSLDATGIQLDNAYLSGTDLKQVWMPQAFLRGVDLSGADLSGANLFKVDLRGAYLFWAKFSEAKLTRADLSRANLIRVDLRGADLRKAKLSGVDLRGANPEDALNLRGTDLRGVRGLDEKQLKACKDKGAIIDEAPTTSSSQTTPSIPPPSQSNGVQAQSAPSAQGSMPTSDTADNSGTSSKPSPES